MKLLKHKESGKVRLVMRELKDEHGVKATKYEAGVATGGVGAAATTEALESLPADTAVGGDVPERAAEEMDQRTCSDTMIK